MKTLKVIIAGSREFDDYMFLKETMDIVLGRRCERIEIVSGKAPGADTLGEVYAKDKGYSIVEFPPDYKTYGKKVAPAVRNKAMVHYATHAVFFWDGKSPGTKMTIGFAKDKKIPIRIINFLTGEYTKS